MDPERLVGARRAFPQRFCKCVAGVAAVELRECHAARSCGGRGKVCALALAADAAAALRSTIDGTNDERFLERDAALEGRVEA